MSVHNSESVKSLINEWATRNHTALNAHYAAAKYFSKGHYLIGIPAATLAFVVGSSVFVSLSKDVNTTIKLAVTFASVLSAVLTGLQTFLNYNQRSEKHRLVASKYSAVKREIEQLLTLPEENLKSSKKEIDSLRVKIDNIGQDAPSLPDGFFEKAIKPNGT
ncbi:MAG: SLATT domain-containing protein [Proteobacteria bacterium]|nr:SLATT domain-containing protein [Pseudomonadota bacterium]